MSQLLHSADRLAESPGTDPLILRNVYKRFGDVCAVNGLTLTITPGEVVAFLGPNGAGKRQLLTWFCRCRNQQKVLFPCMG